MKDIDCIKEYARVCYSGQTYGNSSYMYHLRCVANKVKQLYNVHDDNILVGVAWLHDVIEDTVCYYDDIIYCVGEEGLRAVIAMSKRTGETTEEYFASVKANAVALRVKIADTICNMEECILQGDFSRAEYYSRRLTKLLKE